MVIWVSLLCLNVTSCSNDDDDFGGSSKDLIGTWCCESRFHGGADYFTFKKKGKYSWECPGSWFESVTGTYAYSAGILTVVKDGGSSEIFLIQFVSSDTFILTDEDGDSYRYYKV